MGKFFEFIGEFFQSSGIAGFFADGGWKNLIMMAIALVLIFLAIKKDFEPYLLLPIGFAMLLVNIPYAGTELLGEDTAFIAFLSKGLPIYPCLIFLCIGATTDFGPLIANKKNVALYNAIYQKPLDEELISSELINYQTIIIYDAYATENGFVSYLATHLIENGYKGQIIIKSIPSVYVEHATQKEQLEQFGLDVDSILKLI